MTYIDPNTPDGDYLERREARREAGKRNARMSAGGPTFDDLLFHRESTYNGSRQALAQLAARAGKPLHEPGVKPGTEEE
jgi:hypothetical protein